MYLILMTEIPMLILVLVLVLNSEEEASKSYLHLIIVLVIMAAAFLLLMNIQLKTRIDSKGIHFKFSPFINKWRIIAKSQIKSVKVINYSPISDYGGWGLKGNRTTKAYSILGDEGLLIDIGQKKKIMLGTKKGKELKAFLRDWEED